MRQLIYLAGDRSKIVMALYLLSAPAAWSCGQTEVLDGRARAHSSMEKSPGGLEASAMSAPEEPPPSYDAAVRPTEPSKPATTPNPLVTQTVPPNPCTGESSSAGLDYFWFDEECKYADGTVKCMTKTTAGKNEGEVIFQKDANINGPKNESNGIKVGDSVLGRPEHAKGKCYLEGIVQAVFTNDTAIIKWDRYEGKAFAESPTYFWFTKHLVRRIKDKEG